MTATRREVLKGILLLPLAASLPAVIEVDEYAGMAGRIWDAKISTTLTVQADNMFVDVGDMLQVNFNLNGRDEVVYKVIKISRNDNMLDMELEEEVNG